MAKDGMVNRNKSYLMESLEEATRLEMKADPKAFKKEALWCGVKPGLRVMDAGFGSGKTASILHEMIQPGGYILGVDSSEERTVLAKQQYGLKPGIEFLIHDLRKPLEGVEPFDLIWVRFFLQYHRKESLDIVKNLADCLKPGGYLCLLDLDHNCLNHHGIPAEMESIIFKAIKNLEQKHNFDPYAGRKLYTYLYDLGFEKIEVDLTAHHLIYGEAKEKDAFNWLKKEEIISNKTKALFKNYPGGHEGFRKDFAEYFYNPRRFIYTPMILCKGRKPLAD
jgi:SAM-dependent methyltransferase